MKKYRPHTATLVRNKKKYSKPILVEMGLIHTKGGPDPKNNENKNKRLTLS